MSDVTGTTLAQRHPAASRAGEPRYLAPYLDASRRHGSSFAALLWASYETQAARFDAICRMQSPRGRCVLDVGCGRADFLRFCIERDLAPADYVGIEAVPTLLAAARDNAARARSPVPATIVAADIVARPASMFVGAELVVISGTLNTLDERAFYSTLRRAYDAAAEMLVFNFLESPSLAAAEFLTWHRREQVLRFARTLSPDVRILADYLDGDATVGIRKPAEE
jgi:SAM-dependent methyltransferase